MERQANAFASAFLIPHDSFLRECPTRLDWGHFYELKRRWRVSVQALIRRARDVGKLSDATYRRAFFLLSRRGERQHERDEPPTEPTTLVRSAISALHGEVDVQTLADCAVIHEKDLSDLVGPWPSPVPDHASAKQ